VEKVNFNPADYFMLLWQSHLDNQKTQATS